MFPIEIFQNTLCKVATVLQRHQIRFHLTGGLTSIAYGEPRMTQDIDIVVDPRQTASNLDAFLQSLAESDFMYDEPSIRRAVGEGGAFQLLDNQESLKLDIYPRELITGELTRSRQLEIFAGIFLPVVSRVDAVASKLVWISKGSHKSRRDLRAIHRKAADEEKREIARIATTCGLGDLLRQVLSEADEIQ